MEKVFPEAVRTDKLGFKSIAYMVLVAPLINAVRELYHTFLNSQEKMEKRVLALEMKNSQIEARNRELEAQNIELEGRLSRLEKMMKQ